MSASDREHARAEEITRLLRRWSEGEEQARDDLLPLVYDTLHVLADRQFRNERDNHTLQPTALVNEAFLNLDRQAVGWQSRRHFYALAARTMRNILVDHARARQRAKRGGGVAHVGLTVAGAATDAPDADLLTLDQGLNELAAGNPRVADVLELSYFSGLERELIAEHLDISPRTVDRDLQLGRAWLRRYLERA